MRNRLIAADKPVTGSRSRSAGLGGDVRLMAAITGVQTLLAAGTIPLVLHWTG
jgi:hypothetical protein